MCGLTGAIWEDPRRAITPDVLAAMTDSLRHRGPDDRGVYISDFQLRSGRPNLPGVALGHRRLSIIDVACSKQPLSNEDGSVWIVFNGEIYNYQDLRRRLEGAGHRFKTDGDTETLVHLYEDQRTSMFDHLLGMFSLAIWDERRQQLVLARDRLGKKPLYYRHEPGRLLFGSELKSLLKVPGLDRQVDLNSIDEYLTYQYIPHPGTILRGFHKLPPGHYAIYNNDKLEVHPYWQPNFNQQIERPAQEYRDELRELLTSSVKLRLRSDVPLGAFLSGGVDSSVTVGLMQKLVDRSVKTFSIGFPIAAYDETHYAREVAQRFGTEHHEFRVEPSAVEILPRLVEHYDEPFGDSSAVPTWYLSKLAREHVTVVLAGDGGDELFAGYDRYRAVRLGSWFDQLPGGVRAVLGSSTWQRLPTSTAEKAKGRRLKRLLESLAKPAPRRYLEWISIFNESRRARLYSDSFVQQLRESDPFDFFGNAWHRVGQRDDMTRASLADLVTYLPCDLMTKVDIASMAHGLECREPFLDHRVVELAAAMPIALKVRGRRGKRILTETFADLLPPSVQRRKKMGFGVPISAWFRSELRPMLHDVLLDRRALERGYFRPDAVRALVTEHETGRADHGYRLWALLMLELWHQRWIDAV